MAESAASEGILGWGDDSSGIAAFVSDSIDETAASVGTIGWGDNGCGGGRVEVEPLPLYSCNRLESSVLACRRVDAAADIGGENAWQLDSPSARTAIVGCRRMIVGVGNQRRFGQNAKCFCFEYFVLLLLLAVMDRLLKSIKIRRKYYSHAGTKDGENRN